MVDNEDFLKNQRKYGNLMSLGFQLAAGIAGFVLLGYFIDQKRGNDKIAFTVIGMLLGIAFCAYEIWKLIKKINEK